MSTTAAPSRAQDVVVFGSLHLDIMVQAPGRPRLGETMVGQAWSMRAGGKGGNQAVEAARHGARTAMVGAVGADDFGTRLIAHLRDHGVDTQAVRIVPGAGSGMSVALVEPAGDYGAVIVSGVNLSLGGDDVALAAALTGGARWLLLQNEVPEAANIAAAEAAHRGGARVMLNAAPMRELPLLMRLRRCSGWCLGSSSRPAVTVSPSPGGMAPVTLSLRMMLWFAPPMAPEMRSSVRSRPASRPERLCIRRRDMPMPRQRSW
jgi:sugar/nucleoside kinase (ribokinase family)